MSDKLTQELFNDCHARLTTLLVEALGVEDDEVSRDATLVGDLGAEDVDVLDIIFRMEGAFGIKIQFTDAYPKHLYPNGLPDQPSDRLGIWYTVNDLINYVIRRRVSSGELTVETHMLRLFLGPDDRIHVARSMEDGSWGYTDGTRAFPSHLVVVDRRCWVNVLKELEDLINDPRVSEQDLQSFLETHPELIMGGEYDMVVPQAVLSPIQYDSDWKIDFVARPIDQNAFVKMLELKKPQVPLVKHTRFDQNPFSAQLYDAVQQLRRYARAFQAPSVRDDFRARYCVDVYRPDLHLIAGRSWEIALADRFRDFVRDEQVFVESWDSAIERMRRKFV